MMKAVRSSITRARRAGLCLLVVGAGAVLAACGGLKSNAGADRLYVLNAANGPLGGATVAGTLIISRPRVQPGLDTYRIALTRADNELDYYALSRWGESLPEVLDAFVVQSLAGSFATVTGVDRSVGPADFELLLTARHFEARYAEGSSGPVVRVAFDCLLVDTTPRRTLGSCNVDVEEPAADDRMSAIVSAFERGAQRALGEIRSKAQALAATSPAGQGAGGGAVQGAR